jgi:hypothetical protein
MSLSTRWHLWFAWHPVFIAGLGWTWFTLVERRQHIEYGDYRWTEYRSAA